MRRSEAFRWYTACYQIEIDRPNVLEDYLTTHRRDFHQFNTKYEQRIYFLQYFQDYWCVLWGLYRIPSSPWCPFFYTPISHTFEYAPRIWKEFIIKVTGDAFLILREYFICFLRSLKCLKVTKLSLSMISTSYIYIVIISYKFYSIYLYYSTLCFSRITGYILLNGVICWNPRWTFLVSTTIQDHPFEHYNTPTFPWII